MHLSQSSGHRHVPVLYIQYWVGVMYHKKVFTFNFAASRDCILTNTCFTSWETVAGNGHRYSGRPVFIKLSKPRSLTIAKGRLLSATHRTISILARHVISNGCRYVVQLTLSLCMSADDANR